MNEKQLDEYKRVATRLRAKSEVRTHTGHGFTVTDGDARDAADAIDALLAQVRGMREALEFYANPDNWEIPQPEGYKGRSGLNRCTPVQDDWGQRARVALGPAAEAADGGREQPAPQAAKPHEFKPGDRIEGYGGTYEVVVADVKGMAKLRNLATGEVEDWNAYNNTFTRVGGEGREG